MTEITTRDKIIDAASRLFYAEGIRAVSVDAVAAEAGVTKRTLYYHFASKDELIAAYLEGRDQPNLETFARWYATGDGDAETGVRNLFAHLARKATSKGWRGCGFLRTTAELANMPGHPAIRAGIAHKRKFEAWLGGQFAAAGLSDPEHAAKQVVVVLDGAFSTMLLHRDPTYIGAAGDAAAAVVAAHRR